MIHPSISTAANPANYTKDTEPKVQLLHLSWKLYRFASVASYPMLNTRSAFMRLMLGGLAFSDVKFRHLL